MRRDEPLPGPARTADRTRRHPRRLPAVPPALNPRPPRRRPPSDLTKVLLVLRSLKSVYKTPTIGTVFGLGSSPDPGPGAGVELGGGHPGGAGDLIGAGEVLPGQRLAPEDPPPAFLEVQPAGALGDEGVPDAGMVFQPGPGALAVAAGEVAGDHVDHALGVGLLLELEEVLVEGAVAGRGAHGDRLPAGDAQPAVHPGLLRPAGVLQRRLDPVPAGRPARCRREGPRDHRAQLIGADHGGARRRGGAELHDAGPFGANSGSVLVAQLRVRRQRTFSASRIRRTWLRPTAIPASRAAWLKVSSVHCAGPRSSSADSSPAASRSSRPGGAERASAMMADRCASVIRRLRPHPGRLPSPSMPAALNRCSQRRAVFSWQPTLAAIAATSSPSQLSATIRARSIQSAGACRAPASLRIFLASLSSCGARALKYFGTDLASR